VGPALAADSHLISRQHRQASEVLALDNVQAGLLRQLQHCSHSFLGLQEMVGPLCLFCFSNMHFQAPVASAS